MTKRPKLSLSTSRNDVKKRPQGFASTSPPPLSPHPTRTRKQQPKSGRPGVAAAKFPGPHPMPDAAPRGTRKFAGSGTTSAARGADAQQQPSTWLNAGSITKTLLIVGAAALSIYLLKRRLF
jgi:hypothetical protein